MLGTAGGVGAGHQGRRDGLPLRTPVARVAARHLPLRDCHCSLLVGRSGGPWLVVLLGLGQRGQGRPPRVDRLVVRVVGVVREPRTALGAQPGTVVLAQRLERQCEHHRVPQQRLQVDQVVLELADLELLVRVDLAVVVDEQLLEPHLDLVGDRLQAPCALTLERGSRRTRDQDALHDRLQPQVELDRRTFGDTEDLDAQICRGRNRP